MTQLQLRRDRNLYHVKTFSEEIFMCLKEVRIPAQDSYLIKERKSFLRGLPPPHLPARLFSTIRTRLTERLIGGQARLLSHRNLQTKIL